ncbi:MAG: hypothetical protein DRP15_00080 [Candidatus Aenigmatarchaeota archaeon]|nr:MAG: hypothetical protein DRP15_00080 [Candidatus Aenigmarchaeota archaeon]
MKPFERFPDSFWAGLAPFVVAGLIIFTSAPVTQIPFPHPVIFYLSLFFSVVVVTGVIGWSNLVEELGFDVTMPEEKPEHTWFRYIVLILIGLAFGYGMYLMTSSRPMSYLGLIPFPADFSMAEVLLSLPMSVTAVNWLVVALFEEVQRNACSFIFANWAYRRFRLAKDSAVVAGVLLGSTCFVLLHYVSWGTLFNLTNFMFGVIMASAFSLLGWTLASRYLGPLAFFEFSIVPGIVAHFIWDFLVDMHLRVMPGAFALLVLP